jgi:hypothetical protein
MSFIVGELTVTCVRKIDGIQKQIISLIHQDFQDEIFIIYVLNVCVENHNLSRLETPVNLSFEFLVMRTLNYDISIVALVAIDKVKLVLMTDAASNCLLPDLWKEILKTVLENIVFLSVREYHLFGIIRNLAGHAYA